jgi:hypothetical protein
LLFIYGTYIYPCLYIDVLPQLTNEVQNIVKTSRASANLLDDVFPLLAEAPACACLSGRVGGSVVGPKSRKKEKLHHQFTLLPA